MDYSVERNICASTVGKSASVETPNCCVCTRMCLCAPVSVHTCLCVQVSVCVHRCLCVCTHVSVYTCVCAYLSVCTCVCAQMSMCTHVSVCMSVCIGVYVCVHRCLCMYTRVCMHLCLYACLCAHACVCFKNVCACKFCNLTQYRIQPHLPWFSGRSQDSVVTNALPHHHVWQASPGSQPHSHGALQSHLSGLRRQVSPR